MEQNGMTGGLGITVVLHIRCCLEKDAIWNKTESRAFSENEQRHEGNQTESHCDAQPQ